MAKEPTTIILMPQLDKAEGNAQLRLSTHKGSRGLNSCASLTFATPGSPFSGFSFMLGQDFMKHFPTVKLAATQKNLDALHAASFTPTAIDALKVEVLAFYAKQAARLD
jgi:hypothetical protein